MLFMVPHSLELICLFITALPCDFIRMPNAHSNNVCTKVSLTIFRQHFPEPITAFFAIQLDGMMVTQPIPQDHHIGLKNHSRIFCPFIFTVQCSQH